MIARIEQLLQHDTAGDPISGLKWTRRTTAKIAEELRCVGIEICPKTVAHLLKKMEFRLRVNYKNRATNTDPDRDQQFDHIAEIRKRFTQMGAPIISVDTKKRELVGRFKNSGTTWQRRPLIVNDHDFRSDAKGVAIPYGVYDLQANRGSVFVGTSYDTSEFAVEAIEKWWRYDGRKRYPGADHLLILADSGGSNDPRRRAWTYMLQTKLCDRHHLSVSVSHYPSGASKYNPIDHRLFSEISKNWAGQPLASYETLLNYIRTTKTSTGLGTKAYLVRKQYLKALKISEQQMDGLAITRDQNLPKRNYTLRPREDGK
ncbi:MAG: ISAzo13 family transposase [bacterium]|nr:ISAzo13 family transposase [bacterium]